MIYRHSVVCFVSLHRSFVCAVIIQLLRSTSLIMNEPGSRKVLDLAQNALRSKLPSALDH